MSAALQFPAVAVPFALTHPPGLPAVRFPAAGRLDPGNAQDAVAQTAAGGGLAPRSPFSTNQWPPRQPALAAGRNRGSIRIDRIDRGFHLHGNLIVHQQPGEDPRELADRIIDEIERRQEIDQRDALYDID